VVVNGNITYGGVLTVANITSDSTPLTTSYTFPLFSVSGSYAGNFSSIAGSPGAGLAYSFNRTNGVLSVVTQTYVNYPTNITFAVSGNTLTIGWDLLHEGWILQAQTNSLNVGLTPTANWFDIPGTSSTTNSVETMNPLNPTVFYRLRHP
jgi:hypothetical protein